jgi:hypothetical protein
MADTTKALPEQTFTITHAEGLFRLKDGNGKDFGIAKNVRLLEKEAWKRGAQVLEHRYHLGLREP